MTDAIVRDAPVSPKRRLPILLVLLALIAIAGVLVVLGLGARAKSLAAVRNDTRELAVPTVAVLHPKTSSAQEELVLPANVQPWKSAPILARTNGYLKAWYVDIGTHVKRGQLLAEIDTPELDQQLRQARADMATAEANYDLARSTATRYRKLLQENAVAVQETEVAQGDYAAKKAILESTRANVKRLEELRAFQRIEAPFDGVITARNIDVGALIDSGGGGGTARALFQIAASDRLRVFVNVPQTWSRAMQPGMTGELTLPELAGQRIGAKLARSSESIDQTSRTLLVEFEVDNLAGRLFTGSYGEMHIRLPGRPGALLLPINALMFGPDGSRAAVVRPGDTIALVPITIGRDFGKEVEIVAGLTATDQVVVNPPDSIVDGDHVRVVAAKIEKDKSEKADRGDKSDRGAKAEKPDAPRQADSPAKSEQAATPGAR